MGQHVARCRFIGKTRNAGSFEGPHGHAVSLAFSSGISSVTSGKCSRNRSRVHRRSATLWAFSPRLSAGNERRQDAGRSNASRKGARSDA